MSSALHPASSRHLAFPCPRTALSLRLLGLVLLQAVALCLGGVSPVLAQNPAQAPAPAAEAAPAQEAPVAYPRQYAAEQAITFTLADGTTKSDKTTTYFSGEDLRIDNSTQTMLFLGSQQKAYKIVHANKEYGEMGFSPEVIARINTFPADATWEKLGTATVAGKKCDHYLMTSAQFKTMYSRAEIWVDPATRWPVKTLLTPNVQEPVKSLGTIISIRQGPQPAALFTVPQGYEAVDIRFLK
ncbi:hypothetical protein DB346_24555 [Verrucomicrobia bacterium LW23]|nr:hypothetical protein DB346_24555 [Verrucomicrobia bacterium LW23]